MTPEFAVELVKNLMFQAIALAAPILLVAMVIGLGVSLFQAVTSIHEQTLSFVPKQAWYVRPAGWPAPAFFKRLMHSSYCWALMAAVGEK